MEVMAERPSLPPIAAPLVDASGAVMFVRSYGDRAFTLIARSLFDYTERDSDPLYFPNREYASMGALRIGAGTIFTAGTTDWSFGLSQSADQWSEIDQITANLLHLYGSAQRLAHHFGAATPPLDGQDPSAALRQQWDDLRVRGRKILDVDDAGLQESRGVALHSRLPLPSARGSRPA
jgi:hypothetical protein